LCAKKYLLYEWGLSGLPHLKKPITQGGISCTIIAVQSESVEPSISVRALSGRAALCARMTGEVGGEPAMARVCVWGRPGVGRPDRPVASDSGL